jgi:hypothetical protein
MFYTPHTWKPHFNYRHREYLKVSMNLNFAALLLAVIFSIVTSCSNDEAPLSSSGTADNQLRLTIKWPGDDFASKQDLEIRDIIGNLISEKKVGKIIRTGTGMGWMDIVVEVEDKDRARIEIKGIVKDIFPNSKFAIE